MGPPRSQGNELRVFAPPFFLAVSNVAGWCFSGGGARETNCLSCDNRSGGSPPPIRGVKNAGAVVEVVAAECRRSPVLVCFGEVWLPFWGGPGRNDGPFQFFGCPPGRPPFAMGGAGDPPEEQGGNAGVAMVN